MLTRLTDDPKTLAAHFRTRQRHQRSPARGIATRPGYRRKRTRLWHSVVPHHQCGLLPSFARGIALQLRRPRRVVRLVRTETSQAEVVYHRQFWLRETAWEEEDTADYLDYLADFRAEFHDLRSNDRLSREEAIVYAGCLSPTSYAASQALAAQLLEMGSSGIVYPCVRRAGGTCLACFRPVLVTNVRVGNIFTITFPDSHSTPTIRRV